MGMSTDRGYTGDIWTDKWTNILLQASIHKSGRAQANEQHTYFTSSTATFM